MKVLSGERGAIMRAQPRDTDYLRHLSNPLKAWVRTERESICPLSLKNVPGHCLLFMSPDSSEGRAARSLVITNVGLLSQSLRVPGER